MLPVEQVSYYQIREKFGKPVVAVVKAAAGTDKAVAAPMLMDDESAEDVPAPVAYPGAVTDPKGPATGERRVLRGGSSDDAAACCRSANRGAGGYPVYRNADFGFRVAMTMP